MGEQNAIKNWIKFTLLFPYFIAVCSSNSCNTNVFIKILLSVVFIPFYFLFYLFNYSLDNKINVSLLRKWSVSISVNFLGTSKTPDTNEQRCKPTST